MESLGPEETPEPALSVVEPPAFAEASGLARRPAREVALEQLLGLEAKPRLAARSWESAPGLWCRIEDTTLSYHRRDRELES